MPDAAGKGCRPDTGAPSWLHVKPSSASKMVGTLKEKGYIQFEKYGYLTATAKGREAGNYLLYRHEVLHRFLCLLNGTENELEQVEKIEHYIDKKTIENLAQLIERLTQF